MEYIGGLFRGTLSVIDTPSPVDMAKLHADRVRVQPAARRQASRRHAARRPTIRSPAKVGEPSPIKYCLYIIKENRTYDQVFGDMPRATAIRICACFPSG